LPELLKKIEIYQGTPITRLAMKLMTLTFLRTNSLIGAEWSEIDFEAKRWKVPKERMKGHVAPHIVSLARQTILVHEHIDTQMAHLKRDKVSGAHDYAKYLVPRTYMMQDWADFLDESLRSGKYKLIPPSYRIERERVVDDQQENALIM
jgi:integrase